MVDIILDEKAKEVLLHALIRHESFCKEQADRCSKINPKAVNMWLDSAAACSVLIENLDNTGNL